jgi:hypothetical protein
MRGERRIELLYSNPHDVHAELEPRVNLSNNVIAFYSSGYYIIPPSFTFNARVIYENGFYTPYVIINDVNRIITKESLFNEDSIRHLGYSLFKTTYESNDNVKVKLCKYVSILNDNILIKSNSSEFHNKIVRISQNKIVCEAEFISLYDDVILSEAYNHINCKLVVPAFLSQILCYLNFVDVLYIFDAEYYSIIDNTFINNLYLTNTNSSFIEMLMNKNKCSQIFNVSLYNNDIVDVIITHSMIDLAKFKLKDNGKLITIGFALPEEYEFDEIFRSKEFCVYEMC